MHHKYLVLLLLLFTYPAFVWGDISSEERLKRETHLELENGRKAFKAKDFKSGIMHYQRAYRMIPDQQVLYTIASAYMKLPNSCPKALQVWERLFMRCQGCSLKAKIKQGYQSVQSKCNVKLKLSSDIPKVKAFINDENYGSLPLITVLPAKKYAIDLVDDLNRHYKKTVVLKEGSKVKELVINKPKPKSKVKISKTKTKRSKSIAKKRKKKNLKTKKIASVKQAKRTQKQSKDTQHPSKVTAKLGTENEPSKEHELEIKRNKNAVVLNASLQCQFKDSTGRYQPYPDCNGATLTEGDRFRVILSSKKDAYVYLFHSNDKGERAMLFPDPGINNHLRGSVEYVIPAEDWYELDENGGVKEQVRVIASHSPIPALEEARGLELHPKALLAISKMSFRGIRKTKKPAKMSVRLKQLDTVVNSTGNADSASISFGIEHR